MSVPIKSDSDKKIEMFESWLWKTIGGLLLGVGLWFAREINSNLKEISTEITAIKIENSTVNQRILRSEDEIVTLKIKADETSKRLNYLEKITHGYNK